MAEQKAKVKQSGAKKRDLQSIKRHERNKAFKSRVKTSIRQWSSTLKEPDSSTLAGNSLKEVYSFVDKAVKKGLYHKNKGARLKSRLTAKTPTNSGNVAT